MQIGNWNVTRGARTRDPKREAQEAAMRGDWRPTTQLLSKADPDYIKRWFLLEAKKMELRKMYQRAVLMGPKLEHGTSKADRAMRDAVALWQEYAALDEKWIGDHHEIKAEIAKEKQ